MNPRIRSQSRPESENFDELFGQALSGYAPPEPRPGLEHRVLAHLRAHSRSSADPRSRRKPRWLWIGAGLAAAAALTCLLVLIHPWNRVSPRGADRMAQQHPPSAALPGSLLLPTATAPASHPHRYAPPSTPLAVKLTPQERLLAEFASRHPDFAMAIAQTKPSLDQPIAPRPLETDPITLQALSVQPIGIEPIGIESIDLTPKQTPSF